MGRRKLGRFLNSSRIPVQRVQSGIRLEKRMVKVLKGIAEFLDISLGELIEGIVLNSFDGIPPFSKGTLKRIEDLKRVYNMDYKIGDNYLFLDKSTKSVQNSL